MSDYRHWTSDEEKYIQEHWRLQTDGEMAAALDRSEGAVRTKRRELRCRCECGQKGAYLTNITDWAFDIPCVRCGSPNTVAYNPGRDCYGPVGSTQRRTKPRKKK